MGDTKLSASRVIFNIVNYSVLITILLLCIYPLWYVFIYSISDTSSGIINMTLLPHKLDLTNYTKVFLISGVFRAFFVSVSRTVVGTISTVLACMLLGYLFSKQRMPFRRLLYRILIVTMYVSGGLIPTYLVINAYELRNTFAVYILPSVVNAFYVILTKTFIEHLSPSMEESARMDGANTIVVFIYIILPLSSAIIATISVFTAVGQWNAWFDNHIYTFGNPKLLTMQYMLYNYLNEVAVLIRQMEESPGAIGLDFSNVTPKGIRMTITIVTVLPILLVYPFMQRYFVKGIMIGAVKG